MSWTYNTPQTSSEIVKELKKINDNLSRIAKALEEKPLKCESESENEREPWEEGMMFF